MSHSPAQTTFQPILFPITPVPCPALPVAFHCEFDAASWPSGPRPEPAPTAETPTDPSCLPYGNERTGPNPSRRRSSRAKILVKSSDDQPKAWKWNGSLRLKTACDSPPSGAGSWLPWWHCGFGRLGYGGSSRVHPHPSSEGNGASGSERADPTGAASVQDLSVHPLYPVWYPEYPG